MPHVTHEDARMNVAVFHAGTIAVLISASVVARAQQSAQRGPQAPPVAVVTPVRSEDVAQTTEFVGRVEAVNAVDIRARVEGFLNSIAFREGQDVKRGDLLFMIEQAPYEAAVQNAQAQLARTQANLVNAEQTLARTQQLRTTGATTQAAFEQAQATRDAAAADVQASQASLRTAQLNLSYTQIASPIAGRVGRSTYTVGNLVGPTSNPLARVVQMDPIRVVFSVSDRDVIAIRQQAGNVPQEEINQRFVPRVRLANGTEYAETGRVDFVENEIDPTTGTIPVHALFPNPQDLLIPGDFVRVAIRPAQPQRRLVVPLAAVQQDRQGKFVFVVDNQNRVAERRIQANTQLDQSWVIESGLQEGETVVTQGIQNLRQGIVVQPVAAASAEAAPQGGASAGATANGAAQPAQQQQQPQQQQSPSPSGSATNPQGGTAPAR
jgi:membrane fusion protein (multidrug efflux system)